MREEEEVGMEEGDGTRKKIRNGRKEKGKAKEIVERVHLLGVLF